jgi:hypothetical protein
MERWLLISILVLAAALRLIHIDLMEFKFDDAEACRMAGLVLGKPMPEDCANDPFPLTGLVSSVGLPNPPLFIYLISVPFAATHEPLTVAVFIALSNVVAVWLCYRIGKRCYSPFVGLAAAALFALSPWAVVYSRRIWAQDLLPVFSCLLLTAAHGYLAERKEHYLAWLLLLFGVLVQIHFSAVSLALFLLVVMVLGRASFRWRWFGLGLVAVAVLYAPFLWYLISTGGQDVGTLAAKHEGAVRALSAGERSLLCLRYTLAVSGCDFMEILLGERSILAFPLALVMGGLSAIGLGWLCTQRRAHYSDWLGFIWLIWFLSPFLCLSLAGFRPYPHYFIILYPIPFLAAAVALDVLKAWNRIIPGILLAAVLGVFTCQVGRLFCIIHSRGGAHSKFYDAYGVGYRLKAAAIDFALSENPDRPFVLSSEFSLRKPVPMEYRFLLLQRLWRRTNPFKSDQAVFGYVILNQFSDPPPPEASQFELGLRRKQFGPLTVFVVPLK